MKVKLISSTIAQKILIGLSGLALCGFLIAHLAGNFLLYAPGAGYGAYNDYAHALHANPLLPIAEVGLLIFFLLHVAFTIVTIYTNRKARPEGYAVKRSKRGKGALAAHNVMHVTGLVVLVFILLHLLDFRFHVRFPLDEENPAARAIQVLRDPVSATVYTIGSLLLGYHVLHGFQSGFQTLGANHPRVMPAIRIAGWAFALLVAVGFASFPIWANFFTR